MKVRTAAILLIAILAIAVVPSASDGGTGEDVRISIPEVRFDSSISSDIPAIDMSSNSQRHLRVYVFNELDVPVAVVFDTSTLEGTAVVKCETGSIDVEPRDYVSDDLIVKTLEYANTGSYSIPMTVYVQYLDGFEGSIGYEVDLTLHVNITSLYYTDNAYNKFFGFIPNSLEGALGEPWFASLATLILMLLANVLLCYILIPLLTRHFNDKVSKLEKVNLRKSVTKIMSVLMFVFSLNLCAQIIGASPEVCHVISAVSVFVYVCIGAVLAWRIYVFIMSAVLKTVDDAGVVGGLDSSLLPLFKMIGQIVISVVAVTAILASLGVDFAGLLMSAGVVTLGITMGAQNILSQFFSGIILLSTRPFRKGDFIKINNTVYIIKKVKLMFTELYTWEKDQVVTMPNNTLTSATIVNVTRETPEFRVYVYMTIAYEADLAKAKELMTKAGMEHPHAVVDGSRTMPSVRLTDFQDSGIELRLAVYVDNFDDSGTYAGELRERIFQLFKENDIEIPYTKYEITLKNCDGRKRPWDELD
ncbi:MAG: mechanosensitive ion channel [Candidatus Methanomethylophilaceae archaeon]|nr:mechanosensitive ion channel [Candidatus Methanomethylophilaceae archaeon]